MSVGTQIAGYRLEELVGKGGMGVVYRAHDVALERSVALKLLSATLAEDANFRERFLVESRLAASLDHPNVVPIYDAGEVEGQLYLAMRYVEGSDLKALLRNEGKLEPAPAIAICTQIANALDAAHARGLVHRDVKPSNVLLDEREHAYLADFGLTRRLTDEAPDFDAGLSLGTPAYVAPEQIEGKDVDGRADQYSLACLLHECLTGEPPFPRGSEAATLFAHLEEPPPAPPGLEHVMRRALAKSPEDRYASCGEFIADARNTLGLEPKRARWPLALAGVGAALIGAALLAFFLTRGDGTVQPTTTGRLVHIDPATNRATDTIAIGNNPIAVAAGPAGVWVANRGDGTVWRIDPDTMRVSLRTSAHGRPTELATTATRAIVVNGPQDANATVIDAATGREENIISLASGGFFQGAAPIAAGESGVWLAGADRRVGRLDLITSRIEKPLVLAPPADEGSDAYFSSVAVTDDAVWVIGDPLDHRLWRIDPRTGRLAASIRLPSAPKDVAIGAGGVWVSSQLDDTLMRIDPATNSVSATVPVGRGASGVGVGLGSVWVANTVDGTVSRIDPRTVEVTETIDVDGNPVDLSVGDGAVWVATDDAVSAADDDADEIRIGLITVCEGAYGLTSEPSIAGAELPLLRRGARLAGARPADGITEATLAGRTVRLFLGCGDQTGETALSETRRLVEQLGVDVVIGPNYIGEGLAIKEYARSWPDVTFVATSPAQALTLQKPVQNLFRFSPDGAQIMAGLGTYAYRDLGWRRAVTIADDQSFDYTQVAGFVAEFCALGGVVQQVWVPPAQQASPSYYAGLPQRNVDGYLAAGFIINTLAFVNAVPAVKGNLADKVVGGILSANFDLIGPQASRFAGVAYGMNVPGTVGPGSDEQRAWSRYVKEFSTTFAEYAALAASVFPITHTNAMEAVLQGLESVEGDLSDGQQRFQAALARTDLDAPNGRIRLDENRQAVAPNYIQRVEGSAERLTMRTHKTVRSVEHTFNGYFRPDDPPVGRETIECKKGNAPPWARR